MRFHRVEIDNFGTIGSILLPLADQGLVLVTGSNKDTPRADSNGAGKSLLLDAFCWGLWGRTIRDDKDDDVVNRHIGKNCRVRIYFEENGNEYSVARYRKHEESNKPNDLELHVLGTNVSSSSMAGTQEVINNLIGVNFNTFCAMMPGSGKNAAQMTDADIKELLENMLQITTLSKARDIARDKLSKDVKPKLLKLEIELEALVVSRTKDEEQLKAFEEEERLFADKKKEKLGEVLQKALEAIGLKDDLVDKLSELNKAQEELSRVIKKRGAVAVDVQGLLGQIDRIKDDFSTKRARIRDTLQRTRAVQQMHEEALYEIGDLGATCPKCHQEVDDAHKKDLIRDGMKKIESMDTVLDKAADDLVDLSAKESAELNPVYVARKKLWSEGEVLESTMENLNTKLKIKSGVEQQLAAVEKELELLKQEKDKVKEEKSSHAVWIAKTKQNIEVTKSSLDKKEKEKKKLQEEEAMLGFWYDAFSAQGIRSFILDNITPVLNERAKHYCDLLTEGEMNINFSTKTTLKSGDIREKFSIAIEQKHGGGSYKSNSKGERQRANLAVSFALGDLAELHSNKRIPFRFLDEPFEGIDESGTDAVVSLLVEQQSRYPTVFVVTHQSHFKELFPKEITVVKEGGLSRLEVKDG